MDGTWARPTGPPRGWIVCGCWLFLSALLLTACQPPGPPLPRYIISATPLDLTGEGLHVVCLGIDTADVNGVWWWQAGRSGCSTSSGVPVMRAEFARVNAFDDRQAIDVRFSLRTTGASLEPTRYREIQLMVKDDTMQIAGSSARVATERRHDLNIPRPAR